MRHVENKIQACLDGELAPAEVEAVRIHCRGCESCARAWVEAEAVMRMLAADAAGARDELAGSGRPSASSAADSLWPAVRARIAMRPRMWRPAFAVGMGAAMAVGIVAGLLIGPDKTPVATQAWTNVQALTSGSLLVEGTGTMLDDVYLASSYESEVEP